MEDLSTGRGVGVFVALLAALYSDYQLASGLHAFFPALPLWASYLVATAITLLAMSFIITGVAHVFYEGIFVWTVIALMTGLTISKFVHTKEVHEQRALHKQQKVKQKQLTPLPKNEG